MTNQSGAELVELTPNPYLSFGLRLGRDEIHAWVLSTAATLLASGLMHLFGGGVSEGLRAVVLAVVGPLAEKPGLFVHYFREAFQRYKSAGAGQRKPPWHYVAQAIREGWPSLRADLLYHDPAYTVLLWLLLRLTGSESVVGATLLAGVSFVAAIVIASGLEVLWVDFTYWRLFRILRRAGFVKKAYYEARFLVDPDDDAACAPDKALDRLRQHFNLPVRTTYTYRDLYLTEHSLAVYNGRKPYLRLRQRCAADGSVSKQAVQVMYTRAKEVPGAEVSLYRCFAARKEKAGFDFPLDQEMPWSIDAIPDERVRMVVRRFSDTGPCREVRFQRHVAMDPQGLFISVDIPPRSPHPAGAYWLEVKVRDDLDMLRNATAYIAWKLPVRATTKTKCDDLWDEGG